MATLQPEGQYTQRYKDVQILLGRQTQLIVALNLQGNAQFLTIRERFGATDLNFSKPLQNGARLTPLKLTYARL
jgi:hypothetical protein